MQSLNSRIHLSSRVPTFLKWRLHQRQTKAARIRQHAAGFRVLSDAVSLAQSQSEPNSQIPASMYVCMSVGICMYLEGKMDR